MTKNRFEVCWLFFWVEVVTRLLKRRVVPLALAQLETFQPEIVLLDIRMPGMDGVQTLQKIKERDSKIPVIMDTATTDEGIAQETIQLGARDYIVKPFSFEQLQTHLAVHLLMN